MESFVTLSSNFNDHYIKNYNTELEYLEKFGKIKLDLLEKTYSNHEQREMSHWLPEYICGPDKVNNFTHNSNEFKEHIMNSKWTNDELIDESTGLKYLNYLGRIALYKQITKALGSDWSNKVIVDFGAGKCIHGWLLGELFKKVALVDNQAKELFIGLKIHNHLGKRDNVDFHLGDIETCYETIIEEYKPDFLIFQLGMGFWRLNDICKDESGKRMDNQIISEGKEIVKKISSKYSLPYWFN
jgi:hypothetical protein